jgi:hypothetical protein
MFTCLAFHVKLWLSDISSMKYWQLSNISANNAVAILRVKTYWLVSLVVICRAGSGQSIGCDGADWSRIAACYPTGDKQMFKEKVTQFLHKEI